MSKLTIYAVAALVIGAACWAGDAESVSATLTMTPIKNSGTIMGPVAADERRSSPFGIRDGYLYDSPSILSFKPNASTQTFLIGTSNITIEVGTNGFMYKIDQGTSKNIKSSGKQYSSETLTLPDRKQYVLAFPMGSSSKQGSGYAGYLCVKSGARQTGRLDSEEFSLYDANRDGAYQAGTDGFRVGASDGVAEVFAPLSDLVATKRGIFKVAEIAVDGSKVTFTRENVETVPLQLANMNPSVDLYAVFGSADGKLNFAIKLGSNKKESLPVIPGNYEFKYGLAVAMGKPVAAVMPGGFGSVEAKADAKVAEKPLISKPYLEFKAVRQPKNKFGVSADIALKGASGEEYADFIWKSGGPQVAVRVAGKDYVTGRMGFG